VIKTGMAATDRRKSKDGSKKSRESNEEEKDDAITPTNEIVQEKAEDATPAKPTPEKKRGRPKKVQAVGTVSPAKKPNTNKRQKTDEDKVNNTDKPQQAVVDTPDTQNTKETESDLDAKLPAPSTAIDPAPVAEPESMDVVEPENAAVEEHHPSDVEMAEPTPSALPTHLAPSNPAHSPLRYQPSSPLSAPSSPWKANQQFQMPQSPSKVLASAGRSSSAEQLAAQDPRPLPKKYMELEDMFKNLETTSSFLFRSKRQCTFDAIKSAIEKSTRKFASAAH
jgi:hypothetical protein